MIGLFPPGLWPMFIRSWPMVKTDLSIIIINYNTRLFLPACLASVKKAIRQASPYRIETVVVDNASTDGSPAFIREKFPWVKLVVSRKNRGFSGGNNLGLRSSRGRLILFLNADTKIYSFALKKTIRFLDQHSRVGAFTPKTLLTSGAMDPDCHRGFPTPCASLTYFLGLEKLFPRSRLFGRYHRFYLNLNEVHEIDAGFGTFMAVPRRVIDQVGSWDESYFFYGEDLDLFYRIKQAGWRVIFYPQVFLRHYKGGSSGLRRESRHLSPATRSTRLRTARASVRAMEIFYRKFYADRYPVWLTALVLFGIRLKGAFRLLRHSLEK